jgi:UDP-N-acetylglucosamine--N-acetylmuramyl-(pentapeptide) pyrophosphoryl-undecaprenol N-acetylglucosamine transferase
VHTKGRIFTAYEETERFFRESFRNYITVSGNPVRDIFHGADAGKGRAFLGVDKDARILLVLGGSQGAIEINELIRAVLPELTNIYTVVHQTGPNLAWDIPAGEKYKPFPYIKDEMPHVMACAELVMGRSGAGIWEWAVLGKPMLLIPLRGSGTRGDQVENARYFYTAGAALVLSGGEANPESLLSAIKSLAQDNEKRTAMAEASLKIGKKAGAVFIAQTLADEISKLGGG